jgi:hypothetical protein
MSFLEGDGIFFVVKKSFHFYSCPQIIQAIQQNSFKSIEVLVLFNNENCVK